MLTEEEVIEYFYGSGLHAFRSDGNLVTDQSIVSYRKDQKHTNFE